MDSKRWYGGDTNVLCYHEEKEFKNIDSMDLSQWDFWIFSIDGLKHVLDGRKSITVSRLIKEGHNPLSIFDISKKLN